LPRLTPFEVGKLQTILTGIARISRISTQPQRRQDSHRNLESEQRSTGVTKRTELIPAPPAFAAPLIRVIV